KPLPLVVILGPTASGKTELAIETARALNGEIISADSRQIYRLMEIGTVKPTPEQRERAPHHLLDVVDPDEGLSVAEYQRMVYAAIDSIHQRGGLPLLVGGTGQYITAVVEGWTIPEVPPNLTLRTELEAFAAEHGTKALHDRLTTHDPDAAANIDHRNVRRVVRALEVYLVTGQPISQLQRKQPPPYTITQHGLTLERDTLYERADRRVDQMMEAGFLDEVRRLLDAGYDRRLYSMTGLGYAQLAAHLLDGVALEDAITSTKIATHDFIRRQYTWFRGHNTPMKGDGFELRPILWHNLQVLSLSEVLESIVQDTQELV
ncbi:MAG: tRNA (adenosine(37)-N6)-dimethylallyltransferase MiaA, partial [Burkholderiales bacterium]|nr:tRNA (adenosine(37)-N6)-dimethylallyltransferase MiaA [Anaerolineae bacterium]